MTKIGKYEHFFKNLKNTLKLFEYTFILKKTHKFAFAKIKDYQMDVRGRGDVFVLYCHLNTFTHEIM